MDGKWKKYFLNHNKATYINNSSLKTKLQFKSRRNVKTSRQARVAPTLPLTLKIIQAEARPEMVCAHYSTSTI